MSTQRKLRRINWWKQQKRKESNDTESNDTISEQMGKPHSAVAVKTTSCRGFRSVIKQSVPEVVTMNDHMIPTPTDPSISDTSSSEHDDDEVTSGERICTNNSDPVIIDSKQQKRRNLLFLGNLSVDVTEEDILTHFKKKGVVIKELRLLTYKDTGKSRGCGFAEFVDVRTMKNALKFHRSKLKGKFVNIEVTCGGGGKGDQRKAKIEKKNRRQRIARAKKSKFKTPLEI